MKNKSIKLQESDIRVQQAGDELYFCLTDLAKTTNKDKPDTLIGNWMRAADTIEFLTVWELGANNEVFLMDKAEEIRANAGTNRFSLSVQEWTKNTQAKGIYAKAGRYGGTYAHEDIALDFCNWLSPVFRLYFIKEYKRLKKEEAETAGLQWDRDVKRFFSKVNYHIHNDAVKSYLVPPRLAQENRDWLVYAAEADLLNKALFGQTAKEWKLKNPELKGNMRDYASAEELLILANIENLNAEYIRLGLDKEDRLLRLNEVAIQQMELLLRLPSTQKYLDKE